MHSWRRKGRSIGNPNMLEIKVDLKQLNKSNKERSKNA